MGQAQITLRFEALLDSGARVQLQPPLEAFTAEVTGSKFIRNTQRVGIIAEELETADVPKGGLVCLTNRGSGDDWIDVRAEPVGANLSRLLPGETHFTRFTPAARPYVVASVDFVDLELLMVEK